MPVLDPGQITLPAAPRFAGWTLRCAAPMSPSYLGSLTIDVPQRPGVSGAPGRAPLVSPDQLLRAQAGYSLPVTSFCFERRLR